MVSDGAATKKAKMMNRLPLQAVCTLWAGLAHASTVWNPAANGVFPPATGNWNVAGNWTQGLPSSVADGKAVFNVANAAECRVTNTQTCGQFVQGDNGPGGVLRVVSGGSITTSNTVWTAVGYNNTARTIVETGGTLSCGNHLWIGYSSPSVGTLDINGGTVNVGGQFGLGWNSGKGYVNIQNNGVLNLTQFHTTQSISGSSVINIESGSMIIPGDLSTAIRDYIASGKITGYGGSGTPIFDYDVSNPGKTTVKAVAGQIPAHWHLAAAQYSTNELIITPFDAVADFGIVADGVTDVTGGLQAALNQLGNLGGGALFLPAGHYKVSGNLVVPSGVTLRGDWRRPGLGQPIAGTVLQAYAGRDDENAAPFIKLNNSAGINGLSIWYPEQLPDDIRPYPPTIGNGGGATVENVTFVNAYFAYTTYVNGTTARPFVRNVFGTPLKTGLEFDCLADIGRIEMVHFSPDYWAASDLANAPTNGQHRAWIRNNGTGMIVRRIDWSYSCYVTVEGYNIGFALRPGPYDGKVPNGQSYGFNLLGCKTGVYIEASAYAGYQFTRFNIQQAETGVYLSPTAVEADMFHTCTIQATNDAVFSEGTARVLMMSCDLRQGTLRLKGGYLSVINSDFASAPANHIELGGAVAGAAILGNRFAGVPRIIDNTSYPVSIDHTPLTVDPLPAYDYRKPATTYRPAKTNLYVVTEAPYNAPADGVADATAAFQAALTAANVNGGGTVFVPGGSYRLNGTLTLPTGVELRGVFDIPHDTKIKGSLLNVYAGRNNASGSPIIQLEAGAGIKGFTFHYPEQIFDAGDTNNYGMVPYPFLLCGLGSDIYIMNLSVTIPYQLLDLAAYRCDRHYVDYIFGTALKTGIHVGKGAVDGQIQNCQFNPSSYTHASAYYSSIPPNTADAIHQILWRDATPYLFGHMTNEVLHENFVFGGAKGFHLAPEGGFGPSGHCLGMGVDQCTVAMQIDDIGSGGLEPINSQIVTVDPANGRYLETGAALTDTFRMFSSAGWGSHAYSAVLNGGDVRLQLFHLSPAAKTNVFKLLNHATLRNLGGNLRDSLPAGRPFLTLPGTATAAFIGNIINTTSGQMPGNSANVTSLGNLRVGAPADGTDRTWGNAGGTRAWSQGANWSGGVVPGSGNRATIGNAAIAGPVVATGTTASVKNLAVGDLSSTSDQLDLAGGSLTTAEWMIIGYDTGNSATLNITAGSATIGGDLFVGLHGAGTVDLNGGSATVTGQLGVAPYAGSTGRVFLDAGTLSVGSIYMNGGGLLDISGGTLLIAGDARALVGTYISNHWITALGGSATPFVNYGVLNPGHTTILATAPAYGYALWALGWDVPIGPTTNDYDGDMFENLGEYALNGNPTNALETGVKPRLIRSGNELRYVHLRRNDDSNLVYVVESSTNLVSAAWTNAGYTATGTNVPGGAYDEVSYRVPVAAPETYIRLKIQHP